MNMDTLTAAWLRAAERTLLPNTRLMQELERIRQIVRLQPARATDAIQAGIATFDAYTAATDIEIERMAYRGVIRIDQDPQGDLQRASEAVMRNVPPIRPNPPSAKDIAAATLLLQSIQEPT